MKLDRNINGTGRGKYGLIKTRRLHDVIMTVREDSDDNEAGMVKIKQAMKVRDAIALLESLGILDWGPEGTESEFFVIKLRDAFSYDALEAYACAAGADSEYAEQIDEMAARAGRNSPFCKKPD